MSPIIHKPTNLILLPKDTASIPFTIVKMWQCFSQETLVIVTIQSIYLIVLIPHADKTLHVVCLIGYCCCLIGQFSQLQNNNFDGQLPLGNQSHYSQSHINPTWTHFNPTTPWPALGRYNLSQAVPIWVQPTIRASHFQNILPSGTNFTSRTHYEAPQQQQHSQQRQNEPQDIDDEELRQFSESLLENDVNNAASYVTVNYQSKTTSRSKDDEAPQPLLHIHRSAYTIPTIAKLILLHNNYIVETNVNEQVTSQEVTEENNLLDAMLSTPVMEETRNFLINKGIISGNAAEFKRILREMWFTMYSRGGGKLGSSGFEHVFLAEIKNSGVSGLHNWIFFNDAEANGAANYLGYMKKIDLGNKGAILKYHFTFHNVDKPVGSMFIGTSPEFEFALYSLCFLARPDRVCPLRLGGKRFIIRTYTYQYRGKKLIGSAFPEI